MLGSAAIHTLLLVMLVVGSAFVSQKPKQSDMPVLRLIPEYIVTDTDALPGGGGATGGVVQDKPAPTPPVQPPAQPAAPIRQPDSPKPEVKKEPVKQEPKKEVKQEPKVEVKKSDPPKPKDTTKQKPTKVQDKPTETVKIQETKKPHVVIPEISPNPTKPNLEEQREREKRRREREQAREQARKEAEAQERERREAQARALNEAVATANAKAQALARQRAEAFDKAADAIATQGSGLSPISIPGPGSGAFVNYAQLVWSMYYQAWQTPQASGNSMVRVEIIVARDGTVTSSRITSKSGDPALDKSVQQALDRVRRLPAFPVGATDETRTFKLNFNLKAKRELL